MAMPFARFGRMDADVKRRLIRYHKDAIRRYQQALDDKATNELEIAMTQVAISESQQILRALENNDESQSDG